MINYISPYLVYHISRHNINMRISRAQYMGAKLALRYLQAQKKSKATGFDNIDQVILELNSVLSQYDSNWQKLNYKLSETDLKSQKHMKALWILKSRSGKQTSILQYGYLSTK